MNKIICEVCGAAYPDTVNRCPICGCVRNTIPSTPVSHKKVDVDGSGEQRSSGGKYSKSNIRKKKRQAILQEFPKEYIKYIAVGVAVFMLFALLLGLIVRSCNNDGGKPPIEIGGTTEPTTEATTEDTTEATSEPLPTGRPCTAINLSSLFVEIKVAGGTHKLTATLTPEDTTENLSFVSSNPAVATVGDDGTITAVSDGTATITVTCGTVVATCQVTVQIPEPTEPVIEYKISHKDVTLYIGKAGWDRFGLYLKDPDGERMDVEWVASKDGVVKISNNTIKGIAPGVVYVRTTFEGKTYSCKVIVRNS